jgi:hypothetical protein
MHRSFFLAGRLLLDRTSAERMWHGELFATRQPPRCVKITG